MSDPYPFESDDHEQISELELESVDQLSEERVTVGELVEENESWRFGHVIVDEAQDLTPMQWRMVMRRVRGRSLTIVGDLAQRSGAGDTGRWQDHLPSELAEATRLDLTVNYRSPTEIHALAVRVLSSYAPGVAPARAIRSSGFDPQFRELASSHALGPLVDELASEVAGQIAVISDGLTPPPGDLDPRLRWLTPWESKGLEFDAVVLWEPAEILARVGGEALLYIALTRATQRLVVAHSQALPPVLVAS